MNGLPLLMPVLTKIGCTFIVSFKEKQYLFELTFIVRRLFPERAQKLASLNI